MLKLNHQTTPALIVLLGGALSLLPVSPLSSLLQAQDTNPTTVDAAPEPVTPELKGEGWKLDGGTWMTSGGGEALTSAKPHGNYNLTFLYRATKPATLQLDTGYKVPLAPGQGIMAVSYRNDPKEGRLVSVSRDGKPVSASADAPSEKSGGGEGASKSVPAKGNAWWISSPKQARKELNLGGDFTAAVRFRTREGNAGALISKCLPDGDWVNDAKTLYVRGGRLVYDIGWLGAITSRARVNDGKWHISVLTCSGGKARLFIDGKLEAEKGEFTREDKNAFVFKIGDANHDFGGSYKGEISSVLFWKRGLPGEELDALGQGKPEATNTPLLNWKPEEGKKYGTNQVVGAARAPVSSGVASVFSFDAGGGTMAVSNIKIQPLAEVNHARLIGEWDEKSLARGARIYNGLCITCHGSTEVAGTLPTALRFHEGQFKNGKDPYRMYQTLTKGFNLMVAQPWMTPRQKYDVIHYIRETYLKPKNPTQFVKVDKAYSDSLPPGLGVGSDKPTLFADDKAPKWKKMNFGPGLFWTFEVEPGNIAYKGIAVRLDEGPGGVSKGNRWTVYDHDTMRVAASYSGQGFVNWRGIAFDQSHGSHTAIVGNKAYVNPVGPGWAKPGTESFEDPRFLGRDNKPYGPLPRSWTQYKGTYLHGNRMVIVYTVGDATIRELPGYEGEAFSRTLEIGKSSHDLLLRIAPDTTSVASRGGALLKRDGFHLLKVAADETPVSIKLLVGAMPQEAMNTIAAASGPPIALKPLLGGGAKRWPEMIETEGLQSEGTEALVADEIKLPMDNPWDSWMRLGGFDFFKGGKRAAVATWLGDVWIVDGVDGEFSKHSWKRIATGLFQPLGVKVVEGKIFVTCRDQLVKLHDLNGDEEIDYYECFNNDHQVTEHFHEFAMGLQTDAEGNFYYAKSARHAKTALVPHHGTLLKVSKDGSKTDIVAAGFRAANGVCINPDGSFIVTDQEGHWNPKNRINWVKPGGFYGNMYGYHDVTDTSDEAMDPPLCWITNRFDRSPGELLWVRDGAKWGPLNGSLLNISYGMGHIFLVPHETIGGQVQGGMISLGFDFPTGTMRGRFHSENGQLYSTGMFAWAGNKRQDGGFYRIRYTGAPMTLPVGLKAKKKGVVLEFTGKLDPESAAEAGNYKVKVWGLKRTRNYGSKHYDEHPIKVEKAVVSKDGTKVFLEIPEIAPTWGMEIAYEIKSADGKVVKHVIHNTIHALGGD